MEFRYVFLRKDSLINNFKKYQKKIYINSLLAINKSKFKNNIYYLNKKIFIKNPSTSFDYAILEKTKKINAIKLDIPWSDLGKLKGILLMFKKNKNELLLRKKIFITDHGEVI